MKKAKGLPLMYETPKDKEKKNSKDGKALEDSKAIRCRFDCF